MVSAPPSVPTVRGVREAPAPDPTIVRPRRSGSWKVLLPSPEPSKSLLNNATSSLLNFAQRSVNLLSLQGAADDLNQALNAPLQSVADLAASIKALEAELKASGAPSAAFDEPAVAAAGVTAALLLPSQDELQQELTALRTKMQSTLRDVSLFASNTAPSLDSFQTLLSQVDSTLSFSQSAPFTAAEYMLDLIDDSTAEVATLMQSISGGWTGVLQDVNSVRDGLHNVSDTVDRLATISSNLTSIVTIFTDFEKAAEDVVLRELVHSQAAEQLRAFVQQLDGSAKVSLSEAMTALQTVIRSTIEPLYATIDKWEVKLSQFIADQVSTHTSSMTSTISELSVLLRKAHDDLAMVISVANLVDSILAHTPIASATSSVRQTVMSVSQSIFRILDTAELWSQTAESFGNADTLLQNMRSEMSNVRAVIESDFSSAIFSVQAWCDSNIDSLFELVDLPNLFPIAFSAFHDRMVPLLQVWSNTVSPPARTVASGIRNSLSTVDDIIALVNSGTDMQALLQRLQDTVAPTRDLLRAFISMRGSFGRDMQSQLASTKALIAQYPTFVARLQQVASDLSSDDSVAAVLADVEHMFSCPSASSCAASSFFDNLNAVAQSADTFVAGGQQAQQLLSTWSQETAGNFAGLVSQAPILQNLQSRVNGFLRMLSAPASGISGDASQLSSLAIDQLCHAQGFTATAVETSADVHTAVDLLCRVHSDGLDGLASEAASRLQAVANTVLPTLNAYVGQFNDAVRLLRNATTGHFFDAGAPLQSIADKFSSLCNLTSNCVASPSSDCSKQVGTQLSLSTVSGICRSQLTSVVDPANSAWISTFSQFRATAAAISTDATKQMGQQLQSYYDMLAAVGSPSTSTASISARRLLQLPTFSLNSWMQNVQNLCSTASTNPNVPREIVNAANGVCTVPLNAIAHADNVLFSSLDQIRQFISPVTLSSIQASIAAASQLFTVLRSNSSVALPDLVAQLRGVCRSVLLLPSSLQPPQFVKDALSICSSGMAGYSPLSNLIDTLTSDYSVVRAAKHPFSAKIAQAISPLRPLNQTQLDFNRLILANNLINTLMDLAQATTPSGGWSSLPQTVQTAVKYSLSLTFQGSDTASALDTVHNVVTYFRSSEHRNLVSTVTTLAAVTSNSRNLTSIFPVITAVRGLLSSSWAPVLNQFLDASTLLNLRMLTAMPLSSASATFTGGASDAFMEFGAVPIGYSGSYAQFLLIDVIDAIGSWSQGFMQAQSDALQPILNCVKRGSTCSMTFMNASSSIASFCAIPVNSQYVAFIVSSWWFTARNALCNTKVDRLFTNVGLTSAFPTISDRIAASGDLNIWLSSVVTSADITSPIAPQISVALDPLYQAASIPLQLACQSHSSSVLCSAPTGVVTRMTVLDVGSTTRLSTRGVIQSVSALCSLWNAHTGGWSISLASSVATVCALSSSDLQLGVTVMLSTLQPVYDTTVFGLAPAFVAYDQLLYNALSNLRQSLTLLHHSPTIGQMDADAPFAGPAASWAVFDFLDGLQSFCDSVQDGNGNYSINATIVKSSGIPLQYVGHVEQLCTLSWQQLVKEMLGPLLDNVALQLQDDGTYAVKYAEKWLYDLLAPLYSDVSYLEDSLASLPALSSTVTTICSVASNNTWLGFRVGQNLQALVQPLCSLPLGQALGNVASLQAIVSQTFDPITQKLSYGTQQLAEITSTLDAAVQQIGTPFLLTDMFATLKRACSLATSGLTVSIDSSVADQWRDSLCSGSSVGDLISGPGLAFLDQSLSTVDTHLVSVMQHVSTVDARVTQFAAQARSFLNAASTGVPPAQVMSLVHDLCNAQLPDSAPRELSAATQTLCLLDSPTFSNQQEFVTAQIARVRSLASASGVASAQGALSDFLTSIVTLPQITTPLDQLVGELSTAYDFVHGTLLQPLAFAQSVAQRINGFIDNVQKARQAAVLIPSQAIARASAVIQSLESDGIGALRGVAAVGSRVSSSLISFSRALPSNLISGLVNTIAPLADARLLPILQSQVDRVSSFINTVQALSQGMSTFSSTVQDFLDGFSLFAAEPARSSPPVPPLSQTPWCSTRVCLQQPAQRMSDLMMGIFGLRYLPLWDASTTALITNDRRRRTFILPGLWSEYKLQAHTPLTTAGDGQPILLGYTFQGVGPRANTSSLLAVVDVSNNGNRLIKILQLLDENGAPWSGTASGIHMTGHYVYITSETGSDVGRGELVAYRLDDIVTACSRSGVESLRITSNELDQFHQAMRWTVRVRATAVATMTNANYLYVAEYYDPTDSANGLDGSHSKPQAIAFQLDIYGGINIPGLLSQSVLDDSFSFTILPFTRGLTFFRDQVGYNWLALTRCNWRPEQECALEFHTLPNATHRTPPQPLAGSYDETNFAGWSVTSEPYSVQDRKDDLQPPSLVKSWRTPRGATSLHFDGVAYLQLCFQSASQPLLPLLKRSRGDMHDMLRIIETPLLYASPPGIKAASVSITGLLGESVFGPADLLQSAVPESDHQEATTSNEGDFNSFAANLASVRRQLVIQNHQAARPSIRVMHLASKSNPDLLADLTTHALLAQSSQESHRDKAKRRMHSLAMNAGSNDGLIRSADDWYQTRQVRTMMSSAALSNPFTNCMSTNLPLRTWQDHWDGEPIEFLVVIIPVVVQYGIRFHAAIDLGLHLCILDKKVAADLTPSGYVSAFASAEIYIIIAEAGLEVDATIMNTQVPLTGQLQLLPAGALRLTITLALDIIPLEIIIRAYYALMICIGFYQFCFSVGFCDICIPIPFLVMCPRTYVNLFDWRPASLHAVVFQFVSGPVDNTPPVGQNVAIDQLSLDSISCTWSAFQEDIGRVTSYAACIQAQGRNLLCNDLQLDQQVTMQLPTLALLPDSTPVSCVVHATNDDGLVGSMSASVPFDTRPPQPYAIYVARGYDGLMVRIDSMACPLYLSIGQHVAFRFQIRDPNPHSEIHSVQYTLASSSQQPLLSWIDIGQPLLLQNKSQTGYTSTLPASLFYPLDHAQKYFVMLSTQNQFMPTAAVMPMYLFQSDNTPPLIQVWPDADLSVNFMRFSDLLRPYWQVVDGESCQCQPCGVMWRAYEQNNSQPLFDWEPTTLGSTIGLKLGVSLRHMAYYAVEVLATNWAGVNATAISSFKQLDATLPLCMGTVDSLDPNDLSRILAFTPSMDSFAATFSCYDPESGILTMELGLGTNPNMVDLVPYRMLPITLGINQIHRQYVTIDNIRAEVGTATRVYPVLRVMNGAGSFRIISGNAVLVDSSPPICYPPFLHLASAVNSQPDVDLTASHEAHTLTVDYRYGVWDDQSGVSLLQLQLLAATPTFSTFNLSVIDAVLTDPLSFASTTVNATFDDGQTAFSAIKLVHGRQYSVLVQIFNGAHLRTRCLTHFLLADLTPPVFKFAYLGNSLYPLEPYHSLTNANQSLSLQSQFMEHALFVRFDANDPESGIASYSLAVFDDDGQLFQSALSIGLATTFVLPCVRGLSHGSNYRVQVTATNTAGGSSTTWTPSVLIDLTSPVLGFISDLSFRADGDVDLVASPLTSVSASWLFTDPETGINSHCVAIGTYPGAADVLPWTCVGTQTNINSTLRAPLRDGFRYYTAVVCLNGAGAPTYAVSDGFLIDLSPPLPGRLVFGLPGQSLRATSSHERVDAHWEYFDDKAVGSGIASYAVGFGSQSLVADLVPMQNVGDATSYTWRQLSLQPGKSYFAFIIATDSAGNSASPVVSLPLLIDDTPPMLTNITVRIGYTGDSQFVRSSDDIWARYDEVFVDDASGIALYEVGVGTGLNATFPDLSPFQPVGLQPAHHISGLTLQENTPYCVFVRATNGVGLTTVAISHWIYSDTQTPVCSFVLDGLAAGVETRYSDSLKSLSFNYDCQDVTSGISTIQYSIGSTYGGTDVRNVTTLPYSKNADAVTLRNVTLHGGVLYYLTLILTDVAGWTQQFTTPGQIPDDSTPLITYVFDGDGRSGYSSQYSADNSLLTCSFKVSDPQTGVARVQVGFTRNTTATVPDVISLTDVGESTTVTLLSPFPLPNDEIVYCLVQVTNGAGLINSHISSGIVIDTTGPVCAPPEPVGIDSFVTSSSSIAATWSPCVPLAAPVATYEWQVIRRPVNDTTQSVVLAWQSTGLLLAGRTIGRFVDQDQVQVQLRSTNVVGTITTVVSSWWTVSLFPPVPSAVFPSSTLDAAPYSASNTTVQASWLPWSSTVAGMCDYQVAVGRSAGAIEFLNFTSVGLLTNVSFVLAHPLPLAQPLFITVRGTACSGLQSIISGVFVVDITPPVVAQAIVSAKLILPADYTIQSTFPQFITAATIHVTLDSFSDKESGIAYYELGWTDDLQLPFTLAATATAYVPSAVLSGLTVYDTSRLWVQACAFNNAGLQACAVSAPIPVQLVTDFHAGSVWNVNGCPSIAQQPLVDASSLCISGYQTVLDAIGMAFTGFAIGDGSIARFEVCVGSDESQCNGMQPTLLPVRQINSTHRFHNFFLDDGVQLQQGAVYVTRVRAFNQDGVFVQALSNKWIADSTQPIVLHCSAAVAENSTVATWPVQVALNVVDNESGIVLVNMCLGSRPFTCDLGNLSTVFNMSLPQSNVTDAFRPPITAPVVSGMPVYVRVMIANAAGLVLDYSTPGAVTLEFTPPFILQIQAQLVNRAPWIPSLPASILQQVDLMDTLLISDSTDTTTSAQYLSSYSQQLRLSYMSEDAESGVARASWCFGSQPHLCDLLQQTTADIGGINVTISDGVGNQTMPVISSLRLQQLSLPNPQLFISLTLTNNVGLNATTYLTLSVQLQPPMLPPLRLQTAWQASTVASSDSQFGSSSVFIVPRDTDLLINWPVDATVAAQASLSIAASSTRPTLSTSFDGDLLMWQQHQPTNGRLLVDSTILSNLTDGASFWLTIGICDRLVQCNYTMQQLQFHESGPVVDRPVAANVLQRSGTYYSASNAITFSWASPTTPFSISSLRWSFCRVEVDVEAMSQLNLTASHSDCPVPLSPLSTNTTSVNQTAALEAGVNYQAFLIACDSLGLCSSTSSAPFVFDVTPPIGWIRFAEADAAASVVYWSDATRFPLSFHVRDQETPWLQSIVVCVGSSPINATDYGCKNVPVNSRSTVLVPADGNLTHFVLRPSRLLYAQVLVTNIIGLSASYISSAVTVDLTAPDTTNAIVRIAGQGDISQIVYRTVTDDLSAAWDAFTDAESHAVSYEVTMCEGSAAAPGPCPLPWLAVGVDTSVEWSALSLSSLSPLTQYAARVRGTNAAMLSVEVWSASRWMRLTNPPVTLPIVTGCINASASPSTAAWLPASQEPKLNLTYRAFSSVVSACFNVSGPQVGGTNSFDWRVCDDSTSCAAEWLSLRLLQPYARINLSFVPQQPLLHGSRGHVEVRSTNVAGLSSISVSTSWLVDQTVPVLPANPRIVTNGLSDGYQSRLNTIAFECESGQDDESGIARYDVAVGTRSEPLLFQQWAPVGCASISMDGHRVILSCNISTPLSLQQLALQQPTIFLITVRAVNRAGLFSSRASQLVTLAPAPPTSASSLISFTGLHRQLFSSDNATEAYAITDLRWGEMSWNLVLANDSTAVAAFDIAFHFEPKYFDSNVVNADAFTPNVLQWQPMGTAQQASFLALNFTLPPLARVFPLVRAIALSGAYVVFSLPQPLIYLPAPPEALAVSLQQPSVNLTAAASVVFTAQWNLSRDTWLRNYLQTLELQLCVVLPNEMAAVGDNCQPTVAIPDPIAGTVNLHVDAPMQGAAYRVYVRLSNLAGLSSTSESVVVVYDTTAPTAGPVTIVAQDAAGMWLNSLQRLQLYVSDFSDPESVNLTYKLALTVDDAFPSLSNLLLPWVDVTRAVPNVQLVDRTYVQNQSRALFNSSMVAVNLIDILTQMSTNSTVPTMLSAWVVVTNAANLSVTAHSATVGLDLTAPIQPQNISLNGAILQTAPFGTNRPLISLPFVSISRSLTLNLTGWTAPISGIGTYEICITLVSNLSSVTDQSFSSFSTRALLPCRIVVLPQGQDALTIPALPNTWPDGSVLSLSLSATSNAGLRTQVESKFAVDTTPPLPPLVIDESCIEVGANDTSGGDIDYSSTPSMICASWNAATDSQSGIIAYEFGVFASPIAVGPQTLAPTPSSWVPIVPFTPVFGFRIRRTLSVDMRTGVRYTAAVRVTNSARLSVIAQSDSFVLDVASVAVQSALIQPRPDANNLVAASTGILFSNISRLHSPNSTSSPAPVATNATTTSTNVGAFALAPGDRVNVSLEASIDLGLLPHSCAGVSADECALANTNFQLPANYTESLAKLNLTVVDPKALGGVTEAASYSIAPMVSVAYRLWQHVPIASNSSNANNTDLTKGGSDNSTLIDASSNFQLLSHSPLSRSISSQYSACCDIYDAARVRDQPSLAIIAEQGVMQPTSRSRAQLFNTTYAHSIASKGDYIAVASTEMVQLLYVAGMSPVVAGTWNLPALRSSHSLNPPVPAGGMKPLVVMSDSQLLISNWGMVHHFSLTNGRNFSTSSPPLSFIRHDFLASDTGIRLPPSTLFASAMDLADRYAVFCAPADPVVTETVLYTYSCSGVNNASPNEPCLWKPSQTVATPNSFSSCTGVALSMPLSRLVIASAGSAVNIYSISVVSSTIQTTWIQTVRAAQVGAGSGFAASIALIDAYLAVTTMPALNAIANDSTLVTSAPMVHVFDLSQITGVRSVCNTSTGNLPKSVQNNPTLGAHVSVQLRRAPLTSKQGKQPSSIGYATLMIAVASLNPPSIELFHARLGLNQSDSVCHWSAHFQPADAISAASPSQRVQSVISGERVWMAMPDRVNLGADGNVTSLGSLSFASYCNPWQRLVASNDSSVFPYMCESCPSEYQSRGGVDGTCSACGNSTSQQCYSDGAIVTDVLDDLSILTHGARYFVEINATAASGNWRAINTSSFIYDITPPTTGNLFQLVYTPEFLHLDSETQNQTAQGAQLPQNCLSCGNETLWQSRCDGLALQFTGFKEDATEISYYEWWVGTAPNTNNILKQFLSSFASIAVNGSLTLIPGVPYYSTLFAVNSVGLRSNVTSAGMSCTVTPPYLEFVKDGMQFNVDVSSQSFTDYMFANYHAIDQFAPIGEYYVAFAGERNLNKSFTSKLKWIPASNATMFVSAASLVPGLTWYSYAYALNAAGLKSQILASDGVVIGKAEVVIGDDAATGGQVTNFMIDPVNITHVSTNASTSGLPNGYAAAMVVSVPPQPANHTLRLLGQTLTPNDIQMAATNLSANSSLVGVVQPTVYLPPFPNLHWANYSFTLSALEGNMPVHGYIFSSPINLTLAWDPTPLLLLNPSLANDPGAIARQVPAMTLFDTTQQKWILARDTCAEPQDWFDLPNKLYTVKVCHLTQFAIAYSEAPVAAANLTQPVWVAPSAVWIDGSQSYSPGEGATLARFNWSVQHAEALPGLQTFANCSLPIIYPLPLSPAKYFQPPLSMHAVRETNWTDVVSSIWRAANVSDQSAALTPFLLLVNPSVCNYSVMLEIRNNAFAPATANITFVVVPELDAGDPIMISTDETMVVDIQLHADDWLTSYFPSSSLINDSDDSPFWSWHLASIPNSNDSTSICANEYSILDIVERYNPSTMLRFPVGATCLLEMRWNTSHAYSDVLQSVVAFQRRTVLVTAQRVRSPGPSYLAFVLPISVFVIVLLFFSCCTCWMRDQKQRRQERKHLHRQRNGMTELQIRNTHVSNLYLRMNHYGQSFACLSFWFDGGVEDEPGNIEADSEVHLESRNHEISDNIDNDGTGENSQVQQSEPVLPNMVSDGSGADVLPQPPAEDHENADPVDELNIAPFKRFRPYSLPAVRKKQRELGQQLTLFPSQRWADPVGRHPLNLESHMRLNNGDIQLTPLGMSQAEPVVPIDHSDGNHQNSDSDSPIDSASEDEQASNVAPTVFVRRSEPFVAASSQIGNFESVIPNSGSFVVSRQGHPLANASSSLFQYRDGRKKLPPVRPLRFLQDTDQ